MRYKKGKGKIFFTKRKSICTPVNHDGCILAKDQKNKMNAVKKKKTKKEKMMITTMKVKTQEEKTKTVQKAHEQSRKGSNIAGR